MAWFSTTTAVALANGIVGAARHAGAFVNSGDVREAANEIASFLQAHPESADTIEGIHHWWLHPDRGYSMEVVARALELLKLELVVECFHIGPRVVWRRRRRID